jgi:hypothetical protein
MENYDDSDIEAQDLYDKEALHDADYERPKISIFVIFHDTFDGTNIFTTDETKIPQIIKKMEKKYEDTNGQWHYRKITEGEEFEAEMNNM